MFPVEVYYTPEVFNYLDDLVKEGKIRFYGVSVEKVEEALKVFFARFHFFASSPETVPPLNFPRRGREKEVANLSPSSSFPISRLQHGWERVKLCESIFPPSNFGGSPILTHKVVKTGSHNWYHDIER